MASQAPFVDPAAPILAGDPALSDENRASLWDVFHSTKDHNELVQKLATIAAPEDTKQRLVKAKQQMSPAPAPVEKATAALQKLTEIDPKVLDLAESHPTIAKAFIAAATKEAGEGAGASSAAAKGKTQDGAKKLPPLQQMPRPDGLEHFPPIPDGHYRVLASDGGVHDIPAEHIEDARATDPRLHVLNP